MNDLFDNDNMKHLEEPDDRAVEDLKRSSKQLGYQKEKSSVSFTTFMVSKMAINIITGLLVIVIIGLVIWGGITLFISN